MGSGLGGLECARILAAQGRCVVVLERERQPGGCMQSYRRGRHGFDTGMHYVGGLATGQQLHGVFEQLNLLRLPWVRLDAGGFDCVTIEGRTYRFAEGFDNFVATLAADFPSQRDALDRYATLLKSVDAVDKAEARQLMATNAWDWLNDNFTDQLLVNVLSGASMKLELRKESLPLFTFLHINSSFVQSSWRLKGDGDQIASSLIADIRSMGGEVVCNAEVVELKEEGGSITEAVCKDGRRFRAGAFISDLHPALTCSLVKDGGRIKKVYRRRMQELNNTFGMFTVSIVLKPRTVKYFNCNHYVYRHADVWDFYTKLGPVGGVMVSCRVPEAANVDNAGHIINKENLWAEQIDLLTPMLWHEVEQWKGTTVGNRGDDYKAMKQRRANECIALAEAVLPGLGDAIDKIYTSTPLTYRDYTMSPQGSAFGIRKDSGNVLMTQLSVRTPVDNLLLTGQSIILHGVQGVTMTAFETAREVMRKDESENN